MFTLKNKKSSLKREPWIIWCYLYLNNCCTRAKSCQASLMELAIALCVIVIDSNILCALAHKTSVNGFLVGGQPKNATTVSGDCLYDSIILL